MALREIVHIKMEEPGQDIVRDALDEIVLAGLPTFPNCPPCGKPPTIESYTIDIDFGAQPVHTRLKRNVGVLVYGETRRAESREWFVKCKCGAELTYTIATVLTTRI